MQLLQATEGLTLLTSLTVYGPLGIWAAVSSVANYIQYKRNQALQDTERDAMIKVTELVTKTLTALQTNSETRDRINEMIFVLNQSKDHWKGMPNIQSKLDTLLKLLEFSNKNV